MSSPSYPHQAVHLLTRWNRYSVPFHSRYPSRYSSSAGRESSTSINLRAMPSSEQELPRSRGCSSSTTFARQAPESIARHSLLGRLAIRLSEQWSWPAGSTSDTARVQSSGLSRQMSSFRGKQARSSTRDDLSPEATSSKPWNPIQLRLTIADDSTIKAGETRTRIPVPNSLSR